jgi:hypothetical protein
MKLVGLLASRWRNNKPLKLIGLFADKSLIISTFVSIQLNVVVMFYFISAANKEARAMNRSWVYDPPPRLSLINTTHKNNK